MYWNIFTMHGPMNVKVVCVFYSLWKKHFEVSLFLGLYNYALQPLRLIVRSCLDVPTFATRRLHACHHTRAPSGGRWNCGREMSVNFA